MWLQTLKGRTPEGQVRNILLDQLSEHFDMFFSLAGFMSDERAVSAAASRWDKLSLPAYLSSVANVL